MTFYNQHALVYRNLIRGNFHLLERDFRTDQHSLTPSHPLLPETIEGWVNDQSMSVMSSSGIRVFHDYMITARGGNENKGAVIAKELEYSQQAPYKWLGRNGWDAIFIISASDAS